MKEKILIVDDDFSWRSLMEVVFKDEGYSVSLAGDGISALKKLENGHFDILITDMNMPNMNGIELFNKVKKLFPQIPVIFVSGYDYKNLVEKLLREGASYFLKKPLNLNILKRAVKSILEIKYSESKIKILQD